MDLNDTLDIYRIFYSTAAECIFFLRAHGTSRIDHMIDRKKNLSKFSKTEIIPSVFSDHQGMKLEISNRESWKIHKYTEIQQHAPEQPMGQRSETWKSRNIVKWRWKHNISRSLRCCKNSFKTSLRNISNNFVLHFKKLENKNKVHS